MHVLLILKQMHEDVKDEAFAESPTASPTSDGCLKAGLVGR